MKRKYHYYVTYRYFYVDQIEQEREGYGDYCMKSDHKINDMKGSIELRNELKKAVREDSTGMSDIKVFILYKEELEQTEEIRIMNIDG